MSDQEKFQGFKEKAVAENEAKYGAEIREKYGASTVEASNQMYKNLTPAQLERMNAIAAELQGWLEAAVRANLAPAGNEGLSIAALHREWLTFIWPNYSPQAHMGLAEMYVADGRFTAHYDGAVPGCAAFLRDAIAAYVNTL